MREAFVEEFRPLYEWVGDDTSPTEELFHIVDVGDPSERGTRWLYAEASNWVDVFIKSFAYFDAVEPAVADALDMASRSGCCFSPRTT